jgi:PAS domain S-box-containing protein
MPMQTTEPGVLGTFAWSPVLIVDDDQASALLALKLLLRAGLRSVESVTDARLVLDWVDEHDPDLVLLDLHMPYLDGYTVLTQLRERATSTELPVIVLTADDTAAASERALALGANDFLRKPLERTELTHRVRNLLDMRAAHRSMQRRQRWLEGAEQFSHELFAGELTDAPVLTMARRAMALADADHVVVMERTRETPSGEKAPYYSCLEVTQTGTTDGLRIELGEDACAELGDRATPLLVDDAKERHDVHVAGDAHVDIGPMMLLPAKGADATRGVVALLRDRGREPYTASDLEAAAQFVRRAAIALELVARRAERKRHLDFLDILVTQVAEYAIVRLEVDGTVGSWNVGAERLEGYPAGAAIGRHYELFFPAEDVAAGVPRNLLDEARASGRAGHQGWGVRADGTRFWAEVSLTALRDEHEELVGYALVTRDMTDTRRLELARESFFASLSHDLRTPLNSIQGFAEMIPVVDERRQREFIDRVQSNVGRLTVLIDNLLDHARVRAGAVALSPEELDPGVVVAACVRDLAPLVGEHEIVVDDARFTVLADAPALGRVLANLLVNAIKYSPDGTPIEVRFEKGEDVGRILVADHGRGIAPDDLPLIFDEFERGSLAEDDGGNGLGLASVRQLVALQGGTVSIDSEPGRGTTVTVALPLPPAP